MNVDYVLYKYMHYIRRRAMENSDINYSFQQLPVVPVIVALEEATSRRCSSPRPFLWLANLVWREFPDSMTSS